MLSIHFTVLSLYRQIVALLPKPQGSGLAARLGSEVPRQEVSHRLEPGLETCSQRVCVLSGVGFEPDAAARVRGQSITYLFYLT